MKSANLQSPMERREEPATAAPHRRPVSRHFNKVVRLIAARGLGRTFAHLHARLLYRAHEHFIDKRLGGLEAINTGGIMDLKSLDIASRNKAHVTDYTPTPHSVIRWLHRALPRDLERWTFVDVGAGRGRVMLEAAGFPYAKVIGIEFAGELARDARANIAALPAERRVAKAIELRVQDATAFAPPAGPAIYFAFNPFQAPVMERFIERLKRSYKRKPRAMIFAMLNPLEEATLARANCFSKLTLPLGVAFKIKGFSPYDLVLYATPEAQAYLP